MAGRTSASTGTIVTISVLSVLTLAAFVAFAIFFGKFSDATNRLATMEQENRDIIGNERNTDQVRALMDQAKKSPQRTLVGYLTQERSNLVQRISGNPNDSLPAITARLEGVEGKDQPLLTMIGNRDTQITALTNERDQAVAARDQALADLRNETARIATINDEHRKRLELINTDVEASRGATTQYREGLERVRAEMAAQLERQRVSGEELEDRLQRQIRDLTARNLVLEAETARLRGDRSKDMFRGEDESAIVDGSVLGVNDTDRSVVISIGRDQRVVLGMTFTVYATASAARPNDAGQFPPGKATLEVINVGERTAVCRVTSELRGNPVVRGDVIVNAVYDPNKIYRFVVFGNFDADRDGIATPAEASEIRAMIQGWGGKISEDLSGDVDFVVLGAKPVVPPAPGSDSPVEVVLEYQRRFRDVERYDTLLRQATATSIPVLSENRLYTLVGKVPAGIARR